MSSVRTMIQDLCFSGTIFRNQLNLPYKNRPFRLVFKTVMQLCLIRWQLQLLTNFVFEIALNIVRIKICVSTRIMINKWKLRFRLDSTKILNLPYTKRFQFLDFELDDQGANKWLKSIIKFHCVSKTLIIICALILYGLYPVVKFFVPMKIDAKFIFMCRDKYLFDGYCVLIESFLIGMTKYSSRTR